MLFDYLTGSRDGTAALVTENDDQRHTKMFGAIFDRTQGRRVRSISRIPSHKQFTKVHAAKNQFRCNAS